MGESAVLAAVIKAAHWMPQIEWFERQHTGGHVVRGRLVEAREAIGDPDCRGQMTGGLLILVEVKAPGKWPERALIDRWEAIPPKKRSRDQHRHVWQRFKLRRCWRAGGHAGVLESVDELSLIAGPCRVPLRLHLDEQDGVPF